MMARGRRALSVSARKRSLAREGAGTTAGPRHDEADEANSAGRRARAGAGRRADRVAAGRPPHLDRERVRQGGYRPDRERSSRPYHRGAHPGSFGGCRRRRAAPPRSGALPVGARQGRSRNRFRARRRRAAQGQPARDPGRSPRGGEQAVVSSDAGEAPA